MGRRSLRCWHQAHLACMPSLRRRTHHLPRPCLQPPPCCACWRAGWPPGTPPPPGPTTCPAAATWWEGRLPPRLKRALSRCCSRCRTHVDAHTPAALPQPCSLVRCTRHPAPQVMQCAVESRVVEEGSGCVVTRCSKLVLVDLAGSERQKAADTEGDRLREAQAINLSLLALTKVQRSRVANSTEALTPAHSHPPAHPPAPAPACPLPGHQQADGGGRGRRRRARPLPRVQAHAAAAREPGRQLAHG